jgi:hypothetical protein
MKKIFAAVFILAIGVGIFLMLHHGQKPELQPASIPTQNSVLPAAGNNISPINAASATVQPGAPENVSTDAAPPIQTKSVVHGVMPAPEPPATNTSLSPQMVLDNMRVAIHNYYDAFGENPVGDNAEITAALSGKNLKQVNFLRDDDGLRKNDKGELLDAWGTPFFFHQVSGKVMEIRSAGEDRKMWTFDDLVTR